MSDIKSYKRSPAIRCWIHHILEGKYSEEIRSLYTIFGEVKRIRIVATILRKKEIIMNQPTGDDEFVDDDDNSNMRVEFDLDDGTGIMRANIWRVNPETYMEYKEGDIVDIVGLINYWNGYTSIIPEIIKKVKDPNFLLLRDAEIIKKIKKGDLKEIPEDIIHNDLIDEIPDEIDLNDLYEDDSKIDDIKDRIFNLIDENQQGISFNAIKKKLNLSDEILNNYIRDLEMESKIYQSEENIFQTF